MLIGLTDLTNYWSICRRPSSSTSLPKLWCSTRCDDERRRACQTLHPAVVPGPAVARVTTRDELVTMLIKRVSSIQRAAQVELELLREAYRATTINVADTLSEILETVGETTEDAVLGQQVRALVWARGGQQDVAGGMRQCHLLQRQQPPATLVAVLPLASSSAVQYPAYPRTQFHYPGWEPAWGRAVAILDNQHKRSEWVRGELDLSFASDLWQRLITDRRRRVPRMVRRQLEVCVFVYLAYELKTGDISVAGRPSMPTTALTCCPGKSARGSWRPTVKSWGLPPRRGSSWPTSRSG